MYNLDRLKQLKGDLDGRYCMVSGMLIREEHLDKLDIKKDYLKKCLGNDPKSREVLIRARGKAWFNSRYWPSTDWFEDYGAGDCLLVDEKKPLRKGSDTTVVKVKLNKDNEPDPFYNVYHKRKLQELNFMDYAIAFANKEEAKPSYEHVKWAIAEGSSLSLIGLIKYDMDNDKIVMTELGSLIGGGL